MGGREASKLLPNLEKMVRTIPRFKNLRGLLVDLEFYPEIGLKAKKRKD